MALDRTDLDEIRKIVNDALTAADLARVEIHQGVSVLPPVPVTDADLATLRGEYPGGADETYKAALLFRPLDEARKWFDSILAAYGQTERNLALLPHNVLMSIPLYCNIGGPWPLEPPKPFAGTIPPTKDPAEILARANVGRDWSGNPPCGDVELANRRSTMVKILGNVAGANGTDWYAASDDALCVLVLGLGYNPYSHDLMPGAAYPCPGVHDLTGVCAAITGGGTPG